MSRIIKLEVSNDIFDKVVSFLDLFPKNKIRLINSKQKNKKDDKTLVEFFRSSPLVGFDFERSSEIYEERVKF